MKCERNLSKKKMIKTMNSKMTTSSQMLTTEPNPPPKKKNQKQTKQTIRTGTVSRKWRSHGGLSVGRGRGKNREKGTGNKKHKW